MSPSRLLVSIAAAGFACTTSSSCSIAGKMFAGGAGDPTLYDVVPVNPSVPIQPGEYLVRLGVVKTNPANVIDQWVSINDTITINVQPGPAGNVIAINGMYLDPRINDLVYLRDRGNQVWEAIDNATGVNMSIVTDATGAPQEYIIGTSSVSATDGSNIFSQRTYDFGFPIGNPPGLWYALVSADDNGNRPLNIGDYQYFVVRSDGVGQWERDAGTSLMRYWIDPGGNMEGQFTEFNSGDQYPNITEADILFFPLITAGERTETNHSDGTHIQSYAYVSPGGFIAPVNDGGQWNGIPSVVEGTFSGRPWDYVANNTPLTLTVDNATVQCTVTDNQTSQSDTFDIIYLTGGTQDIYFDGVAAGLGILEDDMVAVKSLGNGGYLLLDLFRNTQPGDGKLTEGGDSLTVTQFDYGQNGAADVAVGQYIVQTLSQ